MNSSKSTKPAGARVITDRIVVATDGGGGSRAALRWVADHVQRHPARITLVAVATDEDAEATASIAVDSAALVLRTISLDCVVETEVCRGDAAEEIIDAARDAALLVLGSRPLPDGRMAASATVTGRIAAHASVPVVIVPADWRAGLGPVVVGESIDSASEAALQFAAQTAERDGRALLVTHSWKLPVVGATPPTPGGGESIPERQRDALERVAASVSLTHPGLRVETDLRTGEAAAALAAAAEATDASLIVIGRRARPVVARVLLGSTGSALVTAPPCAVAIIPAPDPGIDVAPEIVAEDL
jgi:nucleotide-binding universal stress UspA family protein